jgi:hypothetical protein
MKSMFGDTDDSWISSRSDKQKTKLKSWIKEVKSKNIKLAILEIGCGTSLHSISIEAEALVCEENNPNMKLIRINPNNSKVPEGHVGIGLGAKSSLIEICKKILPTFTPPTTKTENQTFSPKGKRKSEFDDEFQMEIKSPSSKESDSAIRRSGRSKKPNGAFADYLVDVE